MYLDSFSFFLHYEFFVVCFFIRYLSFFSCVHRFEYWPRWARSGDNSKGHFGEWEWRISRCVGQLATSEERLNRDKQRDRNIKKKKNKTIYLLPLRLSFFPVYPSVPPYDWGKNSIQHCAREENPKCPSEEGLEGWMNGQTDGWVGGWVGVTVSPNEPMEGDSCVHGALLLPRHWSELVPFFVFALQHHLQKKGKCWSENKFYTIYDFHD